MKTTATSEDSSTASKPAISLLSRFGRLLSAQMVEALVSLVFFLYLAWLDAVVYGEIMVALAAGSLVKKMVGFGLYYPLVKDLARVGPDETPVLLGRVSLIKMLLLVPTMFVFWGVVSWSGFSERMGWIVVFICLGFGVEVLADTFFTDMRMRGGQREEAGIKIGAAVFGYGYVFLATLVGLGPVAVSWFKLAGGLFRLYMAANIYLGPLLRTVSKWIRPGALWTAFQPAATFALIDILGTLYNKTNIFFIEHLTGTKAVAYYSAAWNLIDPISILGSELFLGWVIFPLLAVAWRRNIDDARAAIRSNALWLLSAALPIVFFLTMESDLIVGLLYPVEYEEASRMMRLLVWTIPLSFVNNLMAYVMIVAGAARMLLVFSLAALAVNLLLNPILIGWLGLMGGALVILFTKAVMTGLTVFYCQRRFHYFKIRDFIFPTALAALGLTLFFVLKPLITFRPALALSLAGYILVLHRFGTHRLGRLSSG